MTSKMRLIKKCTQANVAGGIDVQLMFMGCDQVLPITIWPPLNVDTRYVDSQR